MLSQKHDVINLVFSDIFEREIPPLGLVDIEDIETGQQRDHVIFLLLFFKNNLRPLMKEHIAKRNKQFAKFQCEQIFIDCQKDIYQPLIEFFQKRIKALG